MRDRDAEQQRLAAARIAGQALPLVEHMFDFLVAWRLDLVYREIAGSRLAAEMRARQLIDGTTDEIGAFRSVLDVLIHEPFVELGLVFRAGRFTETDEQKARHNVLPFMRDLLSIA